MSNEIEIRVYYEDTDLAGIVYYANYLKFFERGRSEAVREAGVDQRALRDDRGLVFAVRSVAVDYRAPARFDDILTVRSRVTRLGGAVLEMAQGAWRGGTLLTAAEVRIALMTLDGRPQRIPADIRARLGSLT